MITKREFLAGAGGLVCLPGAKPARAAPPSVPMARHEQFMRQAIAEARRNPVYPFGAVIVRPESGEVVARGVNAARDNPLLHGEIACMNDYVARHGNRDWGSMALYTTGEPCSMCMSALVWAGIGGVVFASSIDGIRAAGIDQIGITARQVVDAAPFYKGTLQGGVLAAETDKMFLERKRG
ncbi:MAG TPA: nucleoside deaminase [Reyranella sp.]|jgi:tRNA(Arg) A34 adenosine deaminase TadA|nr:nucleoside deaminase [Reyranella sp.]